MKHNPYLVFFILTFIFSCESKYEERLIKRYIPVLIGLPLSEVKIKKVASDPSYFKPYNVYLRFKADRTTKDFLRSTFQTYIENLDTNYLKIIFPPKEYEIYFSMRSINEVRDRNLANTAEWWTKLRKTKGGNIYVAPYFDNTKIGQLILNVREADGRLAFCVTEEYCYILIESWG